MFILIHNENILFIQSILYSIKLIICVHFAWQKHIITKSLSVILNCGEFLFAFLAQNCLNFLLFLLTYNRCVETKHKFVFTSIQLTINWLNIIDINVKSSADSANRIDNANGGKRLNFEPLNYQGDMGKNRGWAPLSQPTVAGQRMNSTPYEWHCLPAHSQPNPVFRG